MNEHSKQLGHECVNKAKKVWGPAWNLISDAQREGAIAEQIVRVLLAQDAINPVAGALAHVQEVARAAYWPDEKHAWRTP